MSEKDFEKETSDTSPMNVGDALRDFMDRKQLNSRYEALQHEVFKDSEIRQFFNEYKEKLSRQIISRDFAVLYEYYSQRNNAKNGKPVVHKGYTPALTVAEGRIVIIYEPDEETLLAQRMSMQAHLVKSIGMPKLIKKARLDDFSDNDEERLAALTGVLNFINNYTQTPDEYHRGLYIHGSYGVGKTHLMGAMANELALEGIPVTLVHLPSFVVEVRGAIGTNQQPQEMINTIKQVPILVLDDIGAESLTAWVRDDILGVILEYRMQNELTTFFTSNFSMQQLENEHFTVTKDGAEPVKAERLMQRVKFLSKEVQMAGENRREFD
ncbi:MAG TPA: primosomal protein DnaI [Weissella thailandensis]|uniref:primosomal protein DnaI n=1 Tax=Weissella thailandensis TaxID=89061 RepID=UPI001D4F9CD3|nr:primosomal protein DnaI [Weissella thailandensis]HJG84712.1 primosomal protein DnaI [Weissella thailandensis]